jgi:poly(3-hydroxybutyrate) depolymerase
MLGYLAVCLVASALGCGDGASASHDGGGASGAAGAASNGGATSPGGGSAGQGGKGGKGSGGKAGAGNGGGGGKAGASNGGTGAGASAGTSAAGASGSDAGAGAGGTGNEQPSDGCDEAAADWQVGNRQISVDGTMRSYFFVPPTDYSPNKPYPIVIGFHGAGGNGENARGHFALEAPAQGQALFAFPSGNQGDGGWALTNDGPDMKLVDAILAEVEQHYCVDKAAVFAVGFSYGGWMATQVACARPALVRGIASIAGGGPMGGCSSAVAAMIIHGTADGAEPIAAGEGSRNHFRETNGCGAGSAATDPAPCVAFDACSAGHPLLWCAHGGGHDIPDFGRPAIWNFFQSLR